MRFRDGKRERKSRERVRQRERKAVRGKDSETESERGLKKRKTEGSTDIPVPELVAWNDIILDFYGCCFS